MDNEDNGGVLAWLVDCAASACAAAAVASSLWLLGQPLAALPGAAGTLLLTFMALRAVGSTPLYRMPAFDLPDITDALLPPEPVLPTLLLETSGSGNVVRLHASRPLPTPGELQRRIDAHLSGPRTEADDEDNVVLLAPDASAALRAALAELRRALN